MARGVGALALEPDPVEPPARLRERVLAAVAATGQEAPERSARRVVIPTPRRPGRRVGVGWRGLAVAAAAAFVLGAGLAAGLDHGLPFGPARPAPGSPDVARYPLHGTGAMAGVGGNAVRLQAEDVAFVDFRNMPPLAPDQVYELWMLTADGRAVPAGVFVPDAQGSKVVLLTQDLRGTKQLAVTVERGPDGSAQPTQTPQLAATIG
jgi:anti-sigma-K factor RskA